MQPTFKVTRSVTRETHKNQPHMTKGYAFEGVVSNEGPDGFLIRDLSNGARHLTKCLLNEHGQPFDSPNKTGVDFGHTFSLFCRKGTDTDFSVILFQSMWNLSDGVWLMFCELSQMHYGLNMPIQAIPYAVASSEEFGYLCKEPMDKVFQFALKSMDEQTLDDFVVWMDNI